MVKAYCIECGSEDLKVLGDEKYLVCNNCGESVYIKYFEVGLMNVKEEDKE